MTHYTRLKEDKPELLGAVSAYMPNRIRGDVLPGLLRAQDVTSFHKAIETIKSIDEARKQREEEEAKKAKELQQGENPPNARALPEGGGS